MAERKMSDLLREEVKMEATEKVERYSFVSPSVALQREAESRGPTFSRGRASSAQDRAAGRHRSRLMGDTVTAVDQTSVLELQNENLEVEKLRQQRASDSPEGKSPGREGSFMSGMQKLMIFLLYGYGQKLNTRCMVTRVGRGITG